MNEDKRLSELGFYRAAQQLECEEACVRAVVEVESVGDGFLESGRPKILFEAHHFGRLTQYHFMQYKDISTKTWTRNLYVGGEGEYLRLEKAMQLDRTAALQSASWGLFQIMGFNFRECGFNSVDEFVERMYVSEDEHLNAFVNLIKSWNIAAMLRNKQWPAFARRYNGPGYAKNQYHIKLANAYKQFI